MAHTRREADTSSKVGAWPVAKDQRPRPGTSDELYHPALEGSLYLPRRPSPRRVRSMPMPESGILPWYAR